MADQGGNNITIRTMKDDLTGAGVPKLSSPPPNPIPVLPVTLPPKPATLPLPPVVPEPFRGAPNLARRNRRRMFIWIGGTLSVLAVIGGGFWAFVTFFSASPAIPKSPFPTLGIQATVPIPATASVAVHYGSLTPDMRGKLLQLWQNSPKTLLQGNPKVLLNSATVNQFMYVSLGSDARPYLLIPKSEIDQQLVSQLMASQVDEYNGLYILHALNAQPYLQTLSETKTINPLTEQLDDPVDAHPLRIYLGEGALNQIRLQTAGELFAAGTVKELLLSASPIMAQGQGLVFDGLGSQVGSPSASPAAVAVDQSLIATLPPDTDFVRLGSNLAADSQTWEHALDKTVLDKPSVAALVSQFTSPYAYYHRLGPDGVKDIGLIANIPGPLTPPLALGDTSLEETLQALIPLITGSRPVSQLAFGDGVYQNTPLRFLNLAGATQALDYTVQDSQLKVATSKEGMFALLDKKTSPSPWASLITQWGAVPTTPELHFGYLTYLPLLDLLPVTKNSLPAGFTQETTPTGPHFSGVVVFNL